LKGFSANELLLDDMLGELMEIEATTGETTKRRQGHYSWDAVTKGSRGGGGWNGKSMREANGRIAPTFLYSGTSAPAKTRKKRERKITTYVSLRDRKGPIHFPFLIGGPLGCVEFMRRAYKEKRNQMGQARIKLF